jgi:hypothetical protein
MMSPMTTSRFRSSSAWTASRARRSLAAFRPYN